jgi:hypothetical protein
LAVNWNSGYPHETARNQHFTSHSGLALIGALMERMKLEERINAVVLPGCREPKIPP